MTTPDSFTLYVSSHSIANCAETDNAQAISALVEGNSINATVRITSVAKNTVLKLLTDVGRACAEYQDRMFHGLRCRRIQCDEIWVFSYAKDKNLLPEKQGKFGFGSVWAWTAIDADTKLIPAWFVGNRDAESACLRR